MLADRDQARLAELTHELAEGGVQVVAQVVDVSEADHLKTLAARTYEVFGAAHILCNNAGVLPPAVPSWLREASYLELGAWRELLWCPARNTSFRSPNAGCGP